MPASHPVLRVIGLSLFSRGADHFDESGFESGGGIDRKLLPLHRAVIAWERIMHEIDSAAPSTIRRRPHRFPVYSSAWSAIIMSKTIPSPKSSARPSTAGRLDAGIFQGGDASAAGCPEETTLAGLPNRAILALGLQVGPRRAEIASLTMDIIVNRKSPSYHR
jgi:integrase/recombinase XerD